MMIFEKRHLKFDKDLHQYSLEGVPLTSVSQVISKYKNEFNSDFWSFYTAIRTHLNMEKSEFSKFLIKTWGFDFSADDNKKMNKLLEIAYFYKVDIKKSQPEIQQEWKRINKESTDKGTLFHNEQEGKVIREGGKSFENTYYSYTNQFPDLSSLNREVPTIYPELRMYNENFFLAGTADEVYMLPNRQFFLDDFKTNRKIDTENKWQKMKYPLNHLDDCNYNHYRMQISTYAFMLEKFGYTCLGTQFTWKVLNEDGVLTNSVPFAFKPLLKEVSDMLKHFKENYINDSSSN